MDGQKLDQLRSFVAWVIARGGGHIAEWALGEIEELIREKTELQIELAACAAVPPGTQYMDEPDGGAPEVSLQLRRMRDDMSAKLKRQQALVDEYATDTLGLFVGEFWSSSNPRNKVMVLSKSNAEMLDRESHRSFIRRVLPKQ